MFRALTVVSLAGLLVVAGCARQPEEAPPQPPEPVTEAAWTTVAPEDLTEAQAEQRQRAQELGQWKDANPELARCCRSAAETLSRVQTQFLQNLTEEIETHEECLMDGEFMLNEFVDRFGPRIAHLNGLLQVLSQLSANSEPPSSSKKP